MMDLAQVDSTIRLHDDPLPLQNRNLARVGEVLTAASLEHDFQQLAHMAIPGLRGLSRFDHGVPGAMRYWADATAYGMETLDWTAAAISSSRRTRRVSDSTVRARASEAILALRSSFMRSVFSPSSLNRKRS